MLLPTWTRIVRDGTPHSWLLTRDGLQAEYDGDSVVLHVSSGWKFSQEAITLLASAVDSVGKHPDLLLLSMRSKHTMDLWAAGGDVLAGSPVAGVGMTIDRLGDWYSVSRYHTGYSMVDVGVSTDLPDRVIALASAARCEVYGILELEVEDLWRS